MITFKMAEKMAELVVEAIDFRLASPKEREQLLRKPFTVEGYARLQMIKDMIQDALLSR